VLFGRAAEQHRVQELLEKARGGSSVTLVLVGEPGIGKTALLEYAAAAAAPDFHVVRAHGVESEAEVPFAALYELCRPFLDRLDLLAPPQASALRAAFGIVEHETTRFAVGAGALSVLAAAAEERPLLLLVDDAHWLDRGTADALAFALRRLGADRIAALIAMRPEEGRAFDRRDFPELELEGLDDESAAALLATAARGAVAAELERDVMTLARGNPLALLELPRRVETLPNGAEPVRLGKRLERAFAASAEELPAGARSALVVAAVTSTPNLEVVCRALEQLGLAAAALEPAESTGLVSFVDSRLEFRHPLVRSALYHAADAPERRRAHAAVATALGDDERAAWHLAAAAVGADEIAAEALERAAEAARRRSGFAAAAAAYERAARLSEEKPDRVRRLGAGADAAWLAGRPRRALALIEEALAHTDHPERRGALLQTRGTIQHFVGDPRAQWTLEEAATLLVVSDRRNACLSLTIAVGSALTAGEVERAVTLSERAYAIADPDEPDQHLFALLPRGASLLMAGRPEEGVPYLEQVGAAFRNGGLLADDPRHLPWAALAAFWLGDAALMAAKAAQAVAWAREHAALATLPFAARLLARAQLITGQWRAAQASLMESLEAARISGQAMHEAETLSTLAWLAAAQGRTDECRRLVDEGREIAERCGLQWQNGLLAAQVMLELGVGFDSGSPGVTRYRRALAERPLRDTPANSTAPDVIEALIRLGEPGVAAELLAPFADEADRLGQPFPRAVALRCRALLADETAYEPLLHHALDLHAVDQNVFAAARTRLVFGERLRRSGRRIDAREHLHAALTVFERLEARPWAERARAELRASGARLRRSDPSTEDELTPQELQIAMLAADGKTNREVGAQLYLSPKTIEWHLGHVYGKLGIRSRTELGRALETREAAPIESADAALL
jgi:DNA-binding CsgD family transcriptional regulator